MLMLGEVAVPVLQAACLHSECYLLNTDAVEEAVITNVLRSWHQQKCHLPHPGATANALFLYRLLSAAVIHATVCISIAYVHRA